MEPDRTPVQCPKCLRVLDGHTSVSDSDENDKDGQVKPEDGSLSVCIYCFTPLKFVTDPNDPGGFNFKELTLEEIKEINRETNNLIPRIISLLKSHEHERIAHEQQRTTL